MMFLNKNKNKNKNKIFCIGRNKTGTTSLEQVLQSFNYKLGSQEKAEFLLNDWAKRDFSKIINLCKSADAFQDIPFSNDFTFQALDTAFPNSKFILTIRNSAEEWYESHVRFHTKLIGKNRLPTADDLKAFSYRYKGWLWEEEMLVYNIDETTLYNKDIYIQHYYNHNARVIEYFRCRKNDLLVLNIGSPLAMRSLCDFLGVDFLGQEFPHLNQSS